MAIVDANTVLSDYQEITATTYSQRTIDFKHLLIMDQAHRTCTFTLWHRAHMQRFAYSNLRLAY